MDILLTKLVVLIFKVKLHGMWKLRGQICLEKFLGDKNETGDKVRGLNLYFDQQNIIGRLPELSN